MSEETLTKEMSPSTDEQKKAMQGVPYLDRKSAVVGNWFTFRYCVCGLMLCEILYESRHGALDGCIENTSILERDKKLWACLPQGSETRDPEKG